MSNKLFTEFVGASPNARLEKSTPFDFMSEVDKTIKRNTPNVSYTENGAKGYRTTGKALLDLNFQVSSLRNKTENEIYEMFMKAFYEDPLIAWKWLFYCRDIRGGGLGERRTFRAVIKEISETRPKEMALLIPYVAEYGRYDDLWCLLGTSLQPIVIKLINAQLEADIEAYQNNKSISLLAKWLPSRNASSKDTKKKAEIIIKELGITESTYRKLLSKLRAKLNVVETLMTAKKWSVIDYNAVPAKANLKYNSAFLRNDEERRRAYLAALEKGDKSVKINAGTLFPHEIVHKYNGVSHDTALEQLWKNLPDYVKGGQNVMVVADGSGSMTRRVDNVSRVTALEVANALAIYFAERASGVYKDQYITFSSHPKYVSFKKAESLKEKIQIARRHDEVANTNIEAVFDLILKTAKENKLSQEDLPQTILILSDMQMDSCSRNNNGDRVNDTLFANIARRYKKAGYLMPRLCFWNLMGRSNPTIPVIQNEMGVALVSGFSPAICKMVLSNQTDPYEALLEQLNTERYQPIEDVLKGENK